METLSKVSVVLVVALILWSSEFYSLGFSHSFLAFLKAVLVPN
jgi:hypothetical protein